MVNSMPGDYNTHVSVIEGGPTGSILQEWVIKKLGRRHQGVLLGVVRGCDSIPKNDPSKAICKVMRGCVLVTHCSGNVRPTTYIERPEDIGAIAIEHRCEQFFLAGFDHYPTHFVTHLMHAAEMLGYKYPRGDIAAVWLWFYYGICKRLHVVPEGYAAMNKRLDASEKDFQETSYCSR